MEKEAPKSAEYYKQFDIKRYEHWTLRLEEHQRYLGQSVAWLEREGDMQRLSSLTEDERAELWSIVLPEYEAVVQQLWEPDHMNYAWLGNLFPLHKGHGHLHLIPRYQNLRTFAGMDFADPRWGHNYVPYPQDAAAMEIVHAIKDAIIEQMNRAQIS